MNATSLFSVISLTEIEIQALLSGKGIQGKSSPLAILAPLPILSSPS